MPTSSSTIARRTLREEIEESSSRVRSHPDDADERARLFQWLAIAGHWDRAAAQLDICAKLNNNAQTIAALYRSAIDGERERLAVFAGVRRARTLMPPPPWMDLLMHALLPGAATAGLCAAALQAAEPFSGVLATSGGERTAFAWIGDCDSRLGPMCELIVGGNYYWQPLALLRRIRLEPPAGLADLIWARAHLTFADGREQAALLPVRYPSPSDDYAAQGEDVALSRATRWHEIGDKRYIGVGQKMWITDQREYALLDVREIEVDHVDSTTVQYAGDGQ